MKKFKIFLLLSILVSFGFMLSSEVHAQSNGPKIFEIGDILPAGKIKISWDFTDITPRGDHEFYIRATNIDFYIGEFGNRNVVISYNDSIIYDEFDIDIDEVILTLNEDNIVTSIFGDTNANANNIYWEVVPSVDEPKIFEIGDVLPAGYIKITWDFTGKPIGESEIFSITSDGDLFIEIEQFDFNRIEIDINYEMTYADIQGGTVITLDSPVTIQSFDGTSDYYEYIDGAIFWEVVSQDYADGYADGYADAGVSYGLGYEHARDIYGYYDPITDQWLSVEEYLDRYGTDKMGQSDFYNNFDKYFIPAMIIVFGGAIVLTILKVFKGRE